MSGFARADDVAVARSLDGALYVMPLPDGPPRVLNGPAEVIWDVALAGSDRIVQEVADMFGVASADIEGDVAALLETLVHERCLVLVPDGPHQAASPQRRH